MKLSSEELKRYSRHLILKNFGETKQKILKKSSVLIVGAGGLGSPVALYLSAMGVGNIGICDEDVVSLSNLQRQVIHFTSDIDREKIISAKEKMLLINPNISVKTYNKFLNRETIFDTVREYDFVIDATDNFEAKFLINEACIKEGVAFSHAGVLEYVGQTMTIIPDKSACYACVFDSAPPKDSTPTCSTNGLLGVVPGILGTIQAAEAVKYLTDTGELLTNKLLICDILNMDFNKVDIQKNPSCKVCSA